MGIHLMRILFNSNENKNENENIKNNEEQKEEKHLFSPLRVISNKYPFKEKNPIILSRNLYYIKKDEKILNKKRSREDVENITNNNKKEKKINKTIKREDDNKTILNKENDILMKWDKMINNKIEENIKENENNLLINQEDIKKYISDIKSENEKKYESLSKKYDEVLNENNLLYKKMKSLLDDNDAQNKEKNISLDEAKDDSYSMECLLKNFSVKGYQGTDQLSIKLFIRNNGKKDWPKDNVYLLCQKEKSDIFAEDMELNALKCKMISSINIEFKFLNLVLPGKYNCYMKLNVNGKYYGNEIKIEVEILKKGSEEKKEINSLNNEVTNYK